MNCIILQVVTENTETGMSMWSMIMKGGWLMIPIFILSVIGIFIIIERYVMLSSVQKTNASLMREVTDLTLQGDQKQALQKCGEESTPYARVLARGVKLSNLDMMQLRNAMENQASAEVVMLEKGIATLATISSLAPMIGFLGTVLGMVQAFYDMSVAGSNINITLLSRGIYTAMITTVAGLIVGIVAQLGYNMLVNRINRMAAMLEKESAEFAEAIYLKNKA